MSTKAIKFILLICLPLNLFSQFDEEQTGAWYMYFFNHSFNEGPWGIQGDLQYRNWDLGGDLEQLLTRGGLTYSPVDANVLLTLGYGNVQTGAFGSDKSTFAESRIYQEALFPSTIGTRIFIKHRFRFEQRFVENQDFRTRYRYNIFMNIPLTGKDFSPETIYLAMYNELFINGQRNIGDGRSVELFDRNRTYAALGYVLNDELRIQLGYMRQVTDAWSKDQVQLSLHHSF
jgi:hypothetical protein